MEYSMLKKLSLKELKEKKIENQNNFRKIRLSHAVSPIENPIKIKLVRRMIARINTLIRQLEIKA